MEELDKIVDVLLIEDNSAETSLINKILDFDEWGVNFNRVEDGIEAMDYLRKKGKYENSKTPSLILLDLNLPEKNGHEVLKEIKTDDILKCIPVIVLTDSDDDKDIIESYENYANAYITKATDFKKFKEDIQSFKEFWFNSVQLPRRTY
jgi:two-component system, chemotaxis family, response regulator Rcp1